MKLCVRLLTVIKTTLGYLQIAKHKYYSASKALVLLLLLRKVNFFEIVFPPRATSCAICLSISNRYCQQACIITEFLYFLLAECPAQCRCVLGEQPGGRTTCNTVRLDEDGLMIVCQARGWDSSHLHKVIKQLPNESFCM